MYGDPLEHPQRETYWGNVNPVGPRSVYDEAKRYAEALTTAYRNARGTDTAIARIFNTYGPRMRPHDGRAIPTFIRQALTGEPITVTGDGSQTRSICYVDDTVEGVLALAASGFPGPVNIGNPAEMSMLELAETIRDLAGSSSPITFVPRPTDDPAVRRPDITLSGGGRASTRGPGCAAPSRGSPRSSPCRTRWRGEPRACAPGPTCQGPSRRRPEDDGKGRTGEVAGAGRGPGGRAPRARSWVSCARTPGSGPAERSRSRR